MAGVGIQHLDLAVSDVARSLAFYDEVLGPLGLSEYARFQTYRGTEEVVYLQFGHSWIGIRPADGGAFGHYEVGLEHLAFQVDEAHERCRSAGARIESPPEEHYAYAGEDYYSFFAFDPDGIRIEVVCDRRHPGSSLRS